MKIFFLLSVQLSLLTISYGVSAETQTPVLLQDIFGSVNLEKSVDFRPPDYSNQEKALGYKPGVFGIPPGMEEKVSFWIDIYTKYTTDQGLLHDSEYVHLVYESVDFTDIMAREDLTLGQKRKKRVQRVDEAKEKIRERLEKLSRLSSPAGLQGEDLRYWYLFQRVEEKDKFVRASRDGRLRFQLGQKDRFVEGIFHSGKYIQEMEQIFREEGLPLELIRMVYVESSFNPMARSKVGASGIWQFMRGTAKRYLKMDWSVDERNDPITATRAAARKLRSNYEMLQSWPLAITGYNHGPYGIRRMVKKYGTTDIVELTDVRKGRFGFASANFYATFLAALEVEKNAQKYFGALKMAAPLTGTEIKLSKHMEAKHLVTWFDSNLQLAKEYNPHIRDRAWRGSSVIRKGNFIRVLPDKHEYVLAELNKLKSPSGPIASGNYHRVRRGETLSEIAVRFGVSLRALKEINEIIDPRSLRAGQKLIIPN